MACAMAPAQPPPLTRPLEAEDRFLGLPPWLAAALIIGLTTAVRYWFVASHQLDLVQDEAQYWDWTRRPQLSYYSKGPLIAWVIGLSTAVFGDTPLGVRFPAVVFSCLTQGVMCLGVARLLARPATAVWLLVIANTTPLFMASGFLMTTDSPLLLAWTGALFCLHWAWLAPGRRTPLLLLGLCMAVGTLGKYMMLAMLGTALVYGCGLWFLRAGPLGWLRRVAPACLAGVALGMLPIVAWNAMNDWVGFRHVAGLADVAKEGGGWLHVQHFPEFLGAQVGLVLPWWFCFMLLGAWRALAAAARRGGPHRDRAMAWLLAGGFWPLFGFFTVWSLHTMVYPNWPAMAYAAGLVLAAMAYAAHRESATGRWRRWRDVWPALGLAVFVLFHAQNAVLAVLPLPDDMNPALRLKGWSHLGQEVDRLRRERFEDPDKVFIFAEHYGMAASLAFYTPGRPVTYNADFGRRMTQYDLWPTPDQGAGGIEPGWDALYVRKDYRHRIPGRLLTMFERCEREFVRSEFKGRPARKFTANVCYNYNGHWPRVDRDEF